MGLLPAAVFHRGAMLLPALLSVLLFVPDFSFAGGDVDKSGVRPQVLKLPDGPGSIEGLGESFEPQPNTGTATYGVPLQVPPGRRGFQPSLSLSYNGGSGNGSLGIGWRLSVSSIQRQTDKGLPAFNDATDTFVLSSGEEMVPTGDGYYRCENEASFLRIEREGEGWKARHPDGSLSFFGESVGQRQASSGYIACWFLSRRLDPNGNEILYRYNEPGSFSTALSAEERLHLTSITYNQSPASPQGMHVEFLYDARSAEDRLTDYRFRFPVQTSYRVGEVVMTEGGQRVRSYRLSYDPMSAFSLLSRVELYGRDPAEGPLETILDLQYTHFELERETTSMNLGINPGVSLALSDVDLVDMDGDALPDILYTGDYQQVYRNEDGRTWSLPYEVPGGFAFIRLSQSNTMLMDMDGDGFSDLLQDVPSIGGHRYYRGQGNGEWEQTQISMYTSPSFDFSSNLTRSVDLNHDGRIDVLRKGDGAYYVTAIINQLGEQWSNPADFPPVDSPSIASDFNFGDEGESALQLADMNGDGLQDFVILSRAGYIRYFPFRGITLDPATPAEFQGWDTTPRGAWNPADPTAEGVRMDDAPDDFDDPALADMATYRSLRLLDVNGDGLSDLVLVANNRIRVWLNLGGIGFSPDPVSILPEEGTIPSLTSETRIRTADMNGNGTVDIVWNRQTGFPEIDRSQVSWVYLDLSNGTRPNLLRRIDNGIGQVTTISYRSSTEYLVEDRAAGNDWDYHVPFPVQVVSRIDVYDGMGATYARELAYHNAYYDGFEKEFRGFARAEVHELGNGATGAPTLITAFEFHVGDSDEVLKGKPLKVIRQNAAGDVFDVTENSWNTRNLFSLDPLPTNPFKATGVVFAYQERSEQQIIEKGNGDSALLLTEYVYDDFGNITRTSEYGRVEDIDNSGTPGDSLTDLSAWDDERITVSSYTSSYPDGLAGWFLRLPVQMEIQDELGQVAARTQNFYDDPTFSGSNLGGVTKGNATLTRRWIDPADPTAYVEEGRTSYDTYGNPVILYDPLAELTLQGTPINPGKGHFREVVYDETYHTFPVREIIHTGNSDALEPDPTLVMEASYDMGFGVITSSTGFNGYLTEYLYDNFARLAAIVKPGDSREFPTAAYEYVLAQSAGSGKTINWIESQQRENAGEPGTMDSRLFYDGMGRTIMTRSEGEEPGQVVVSETKVFNDRKWPWKEFLPYFEAGADGTLDYRDPTYLTGYSELHYDALGRILQAYQPIEPGATARKFSRTTYLPLGNMSEDEEQTDSVSTDGDGPSVHQGASMAYLYDGLPNGDAGGRLVKVHETVKINDDGTASQTANTWITSYQWDVLGNLVHLADSQQNKKFFSYDALSRKIFLNDPDRGWLWYAYDDAGNLVRRRDAREQEIAYGHDGTNRMTREFYTTPEERGGDHLDETLLNNGVLPIAARWIAPARLPDRAPDVRYHFDYSAGELLIPLDPLSQTGLLSNTWSFLGPLAEGSQPGDAVTSHQSENVLGNVSWIRDLSGEEHFSYDARERIAWKAKGILSARDNSLAWFYAGYEYDSADRTRQVIYPDRTTLRIDYDSRGLVTSLGHFLLETSHNPAGQLLHVTYGNDVSAERTYDHRLRMGSLAYTPLSNPADPLIHYEYTFDGVSNISGIADLRSESRRPQGDPLRNAQAIQYDDLYRVNEVAYSFAAPEQSVSPGGSVSYRYDRIGNMISKTSDIDHEEHGLSVTHHGTMFYGGSEGRHGRQGRSPGDQPGPHALTATESGRVYPYDANGNMTDIDGQLAAWDHQDRLASIEGSETRGDYLYDYADRRVRKTVESVDTNRSKTTYYPSRFYEVRDDKTAVRYAWYNDTRVASTTIPGATERYYFQDHLGSSNIIAGEDGTVLEESAFYAFGHPRQRWKAEEAAENPSGHYLFTQKELDEESGLQYFEARYMHAVTGRFVSVDTLGSSLKSTWLSNPQSMNIYAYCRARVFTLVDPNGADGTNSQSLQDLVSDVGRVLERLKTQEDKNKEIAKTRANIKAFKFAINNYGDPYKMKQEIANQQDGKGKDIEESHSGGPDFNEEMETKDRSSLNIYEGWAKMQEEEMNQRFAQKPKSGLIMVFEERVRQEEQRLGDLTGEQDMYADTPELKAAREQAMRETQRQRDAESPAKNSAPRNSESDLAQE